MKARLSESAHQPLQQFSLASLCTEYLIKSTAISKARDRCAKSRASLMPQASPKMHTGSDKLGRFRQTSRNSPA